MPYRLQLNESLDTGLKRIADEEVTGALSQLRSGNIYELRKHIKRVRAILRLLKPQLGPIYLEENRRLRDLARSFSFVRDLDVSLELLEGFARSYKRKSTLNSQRQALIEKRSAIQQQLDFSEPEQQLSATRKRVEDWQLHGITPSFVEAQLRKTNKQSRHAFELAKRTHLAEDFHELRKSVKRELNQLRLINSSDPRLETLKELSNLLGDHHNLAVLLATLDRISNRFRLRAIRNMRQLENLILSRAATLFQSKTQAAVA